MSGGSFNYLCHKDAAELLQGGTHDAAEMGDALAVLGYAPDAAEETHALIAEVRAAEARLNASLHRLRPVWKAMEWWQSCDWSENDFKRALAEYRGTELVACSRCEGTGREPGRRHYACTNPGCARGRDVSRIALNEEAGRAGKSATGQTGTTTGGPDA
jgi:hypothetical protein